MKDKSILLLFFLFISVCQAENNKEIESEIEKVTIYVQGAQVKRTAKVNLQAGRNSIEFIKNTSALDESSIQLSCINPEVKILSVSSRINYLENKPLVEESETIYNRLQVNSGEIEKLKSRKSVFNKEKEMLTLNMELGGEQNGVQIDELKTAIDYYRNRLLEIEGRLLNINARIDSLRKQNNKLKSQLNELNFNKEKSYTTIIAEVESKVNLKATFNITYISPDAGWKAIYDIRVSDILEPITINSKAMVSQNTGENWENVDLTLSTGNPVNDDILPKLNTWRLGFGRPVKSMISTESYGGPLSALKGKITDEQTGEPIPFATLVVESNGKQIRTTTSDFAGNFQVYGVPSGGYDIKAAFVGYQTTVVQNVELKEDQITFLDFEMEQTSMSLEEVQIMSYKDPKMEKPAMDKESTIRGSRSNSSVEYVEGVKQTANMADFRSIVEYQIETPYTIPADKKDYVVKIRDITLIGIYSYKSIPKISQNAFLVCGIEDWEGLDLVPGKSNLFYQNTFIGDSYLDTYSTEDTITFSLGVDNNVIVKREKISDFEDKQFIGKNIMKKVGWKITVRNNKSKPIKVEILDQIPMPTVDEINVDLLESTDAELNEENGILEWNLDMQPGDTRELIFKYEVKYPKYKQVFLE